mmetsp:Transcript_33034/g.60576  ORF Transcript_33034/g.60576 Transcript_33034/m.60576 type:complete len:262 (-) Transcript_33034:1259-2044(-)
MSPHAKDVSGRDTASATCLVRGARTSMCFVHEIASFCKRSALKLGKGALAVKQSWRLFRTSCCKFLSYKARNALAMTSPEKKVALDRSREATLSGIAPASDNSLSNMPPSSASRRFNRVSEQLVAASAIAKHPRETAFLSTCNSKGCSACASAAAQASFTTPSNAPISGCCKNRSTSSAPKSVGWSVVSTLLSFSAINVVKSRIAALPFSKSAGIGLSPTRPGTFALASSSNRGVGSWSGFDCATSRTSGSTLSNFSCWSL